MVSIHKNDRLFDNGLFSFEQVIFGVLDLNILKKLGFMIQEIGRANILHIYLLRPTQIQKKLLVSFLNLFYNDERRKPEEAKSKKLA